MGGGITFRKGDIVWVTGRRTSVYDTDGVVTGNISLWSGSHPVITPYVRQYIGSINSGDVRPIYRWKNV